MVGFIHRIIFLISIINLFQTSLALDVDVVGYCQGKSVPKEYIVFFKEPGNLPPDENKMYLVCKFRNDEKKEIFVDSRDFSVPNSPSSLSVICGMSFGGCKAMLRPGEICHFFIEFSLQQESSLQGCYFSGESCKVMSIEVPFSKLNAIHFQLTDVSLKPNLERKRKNGMNVYLLSYRNDYSGSVKIPYNRKEKTAPTLSVYHNRNKNKLWLGHLGTTCFLEENSYVTLMPGDHYISPDLTIKRPFFVKSGGEIGTAEGMDISGSIPLNEMEISNDIWNEYKTGNVRIYSESELKNLLISTVTEK